MSSLNLQADSVSSCSLSTNTTFFFFFFDFESRFVFCIEMKSYWRLELQRYPSLPEYLLWWCFYTAWYLCLAKILQREALHAMELACLIAKLRFSEECVVNLKWYKRRVLSRRGRMLVMITKSGVKVDKKRRKTFVSSEVVLNVWGEKSLAF